MDQRMVFLLVLHCLLCCGQIAIAETNDEISEQIPVAALKSSISGSSQEDKDWELVEDIQGYDENEKTFTVFSKHLVSAPRDNVRFPNWPVFSLTGSSIKSELCRRQSEKFERDLKNLKMWALMMFDASAKLPAGILEGNVNQYGHFDECLKIKAVPKNEENNNERIIRGKYCLAQVDIMPSVDSKVLLQAVWRAKAHHSYKGNLTDPIFVIPKSSVYWGLCLPAACSHEDVQRGLEEVLRPFNDSPGVHFDILVTQNSCYDQESLNKTKDFGFYLTIFLILIILSLVIVGTYLDRSEEKHGYKLWEQRGSMENFLHAFSIKRTWRQLISDVSPNEVQCLHGLKGIFVIPLYLGHKMLIKISTASYNKTEYFSNFRFSLPMNFGFLYADIFLFISAVIASESSTRAVITGNRLSVWKIALVRYLRFTPALLILILFTAYVLPHMGNGPLWGLLLEKPIDNCRQRGWLNLLYAQNFLDVRNTCLLQTYQLAIDWQLSFMVPFLTYLLVAYKKTGIFLSLSLIIIGTLTRYITQEVNDLAFVPYRNAENSVGHAVVNLLMYDPINRLTCYVWGVLVGYWLEFIGKTKQRKWRKSVINLGLILIMVVFFSVLSSAKPTTHPQYNYQEDKQFHRFFGTYMPTIMPITIGYLICACHFGYADCINKFLSSKFLVFLSRISFSMYLVQFGVFSSYFATQRVPEHWTLSQALVSGPEIYTLTTSILMTLFLDFPIRNLIVLLFAKKSKVVSNEKRAPQDSKNK